MTAKRWTITLLAAFVATLLAVGGTIRVLDPLLRYGAESGPLTFYEYDEMYSNPGIARQYAYDTVLVGTSMIENTNVDEFDELMDCEAVRLPYSGGSSFNVKTILDICFSSGNEIDAVYWELNVFPLYADPAMPRYPLPEYLYRDDGGADLSYLLNLDILYNYALKDAIWTLRGQVQPAAQRGTTLFGDYGREFALAYYDRPEIGETSEYEAYALERTRANLEINIKPLIEAHPDTEFIFYFAPFSVLFWDQEIRNGSFDEDLAAMELAIGELLAYDNVTVFFFYNETDITTDLDNYKDPLHYGEWINSRVTQMMAAGEHRLTPDTYRAEIEELEEFALSYDYEALFR